MKPEALRVVDIPPNNSSYLLQEDKCDPLVVVEEGKAQSSDRQQYLHTHMNTEILLVSMDVVGMSVSVILNMAVS